MLYKYPGCYPIHDDFYDYIIVPENDADKYIEDGWHFTTKDAKQNAVTEIIPPNKIIPSMRERIVKAEGSQKKIAEFYRVSVATVSKIKAGKL